MVKKQVKAKLKFQVPGGGATPALGSILGQHGVNIMDFCKQFNAKTADRKGETVPVVMTVYADRSFDFIVKTQPASELIKKRANIAKGSSTPSTNLIGQITDKDVEDIAKVKFTDLNALNIEQAKKIIAGTARSMGVKVVD